MSWSFSDKSVEGRPITPRVMKVFAMAREEAEGCGHELIDDGHLLLGLLREREGVAGVVLRSFDIDADELRARFGIEGKRDKHGKLLPCAPIVKEVFELASAEAASWSHDFVGTEHVLLGILKVRGRATKCLVEMGVELEVVKEMIERLIAPGPTSKPAPSLFRRFLNSLGFNQPEPLPEGIEESMKLILTPRVRQVMGFARKLAAVRNQGLNEIHVLLGLCELGQGVAVNVVGRLGGDWNAIKERAQSALDKIPAATGPDKSPESVYLKAVMSVADKERLALCHTYLGTEHVFLGLIQAGGPAAEAIRHAGSDIETVRMVILQELDPNFSAGRTKDMWDSAFTDDPVVSQGNEFTPRVIKALQAAQEEARGLGLSKVGALQVLAGLLTLGDGVAVNMLHRQGVTLERVRKEIKPARETRAPEDVPVTLPYSLNAHELLGLAHQEAKKVQHTFTGAEHLLLAILQSEAGSLADFFKDAGVDRERMKAAVMEELKGSGV